MHHVLELVPYQFVRPPSEYQGHFRESEVMAALAKEYGFTNVTIEDFPTGQTWQPIVGELWITAPRPEKIYDLHDIPESVASTNANADITGDLINVGQGTAAGLRRQGRQGQVRPLDCAERARRRLRARGRGGRDRRARHQRHRRGRSRGRLPGSDRLDHRERAAEHRGVGALAEEGAALETHAEPRAEGDDPLDQQERAGARTSRRSSTPRSPATAARRRRSRSAATSSRATSSRAPTTTTRAAR